MAGEPFDDFERWAAEARAAEAVEERVRQRWLRTQAEESAELGGVLAALAEEGAEAVVTTSAGRRHAGRIAMVGIDFIVVRRGEQRATLVAFGAVAAVTPTRPHSGAPSGATVATTAPSAGDGWSRPSTRLIDVLASAAAERPRLILFAGEARMPGELIAVGSDVVTLRTNTMPPGTAYVPVTSLSEVSLFDSA